MAILIELYRYVKTAPVLIILLLSSALTVAEGNHDDPFTAGQQYYQSGNYEAALAAFTRAVEIQPDNSSYHHWLGKSYGRMAESSGILKAYKLSKNTRIELERAVELDDTNIEALHDLVKYYRQAPAFLGGGADKADALCRRIQEIQGKVPSGSELDQEKC